MSFHSNLHFEFNIFLEKINVLRMNFFKPVTHSILKKNSDWKISISPTIFNNKEIFLGVSCFIMILSSWETFWFDLLQPRFFWRKFSLFYFSKIFSISFFIFKKKFLEIFFSDEKMKGKKNLSQYFMRKWKKIWKHSSKSEQFWSLENLFLG